MTIAFAVYEKKEEEIFSKFKPYVFQWFQQSFSSMTPPQSLALPEILNGKNVLISAPTGSGKTLAAFLTLLNFLFDLGEKGELNNEIYVVYVSPLRALNNDIKRNLMEPLKGIRKITEEKGIELPEVRVAVRTGDTPQSERSKMLRKTPHILITTPETIAIVLSAPKFREKLKSVRFVVVDEIHELADSKRGVHLSLSLERLQDLVGDHQIVRIGCSATQAPLEEISKFLVGFETEEKPRDCVIVDASMIKQTKIAVQTPVKDLIYTPEESLSHALYVNLDELITDHVTTLVFTNTRSGTERVVFHLQDIFGEKYVDNIGAHHSSLSRKHRLDIEGRLKKGELKAVVCSTSLELGIDIGYIDLVVQLGSPKSVSRCLQRVGRSGHKLHEISEGVITVLDRDDLVECTVLGKAALEGKIDRVQIPKNCLDVLAQQLLGMAIDRRWEVKEAFELVRRSYCYKDLDFEDFINVLEYLAGEYVELESRRVYAKIWLDRVDERFGKRGRLTRVIYYTNVGTIPQETQVDIFVRHGKKKSWVGSIDEGFLERLSPGDIFVLGGKTWKFKYARGLKAYVSPAPERRPTIPSWVSEMLPLSFDSALEVGRFRKKVSQKILRGEKKEKIVEWISGEFPISVIEATNIVNYFIEQLKFTGGIMADNETLVVETVVDDMGRQNIIFHSLFGRRINDALSRAYGYFLSKIVRGNVSIAINDNGFSLTIPKGLKVLNVEDFVRKITKDNLENLLKESLEKTELFKRRFRHCATRALMILKQYKGHKISIGRQTMNAHFLIAAIKQISENFPILKETFREIVEDHMDIINAKKVLDWMEEGKLNVVVFEGSDIPSPFAHNLFAIGQSDVILMADRKELLERLHKQVLEKIKAQTQELTNI
ncbi:MAG: ATP-dependent helicase [Candidatus Wukongarchaeota archaeon]|nr:ATP-dependent helicase [Candidatus Wukongarchaeota archaeon]